MIFFMNFIPFLKMWNLFHQFVFSFIFSFIALSCFVLKPIEHFFFILAAQIDSDFPIGLNAAKRMRWQTRKIAFLMISNYQIFRKMNKNRITKQNWATSELNKNNTVLSIKSPKKNMNASILRAAKCNNGKKLFTKTLQTCKFITVRLLCFGGF